MMSLMLESLEHLELFILYTVYPAVTAAALSHCINATMCTNGSNVNGNVIAELTGCKMNMLHYSENLNQQLRTADLCRKSTPSC
jgi:hypothetical protein